MESFPMECAPLPTILAPDYDNSVVAVTISRSLEPFFFNQAQKNPARQGFLQSFLPG
jgi:hypothetical protein